MELLRDSKDQTSIKVYRKTRGYLFNYCLNSERVINCTDAVKIIPTTRKYKLLL